MAAPIGLSPLLILTLCGSERVFVVSTEVCTLPRNAFVQVVQEALDRTENKPQLNESSERVVQVAVADRALLSVRAPESPEPDTLTKAVGSGGAKATQWRGYRKGTDATTNTIITRELECGK